MVYLYPYNSKSESAKAISKALGARMIRLENSRFRGKGKIVVNWGNSMTNEEIEQATVLNRPESVALVSNKLTFFNHVAGRANIPDWSIHRKQAEEWLANGKIVCVREKLTGHSGEGLVIFNDLASFSDYDHSQAKMYVLYIPKKDEYRVHVVGNQVVDIQRKAKRAEIPANAVNWKIRSHANGFVFVREGVRETTPQEVFDQALNVVNLCGLHFGAVDVIWNDYRKAAYVLEINTAPGVENTTVDTYVSSLQDLINEITLEVVPRRANSRSNQWFVQPLRRVNPFNDLNLTNEITMPEDRIDD
jgi:glutathione synthase/RimK-type ligase-like ATP-grasp enzyme